MYGRVWRFTPVLTPGLAISIDWNRLSLILIPAWPKTIDQGAELSSGFNDIPAPPPAPRSPPSDALFFYLGRKGRGLLLHLKAEVTQELSSHPQAHTHLFQHQAITV